MQTLNTENHEPFRLKAVFGGTFDPPHLGHLRPLLSVLDLLGLDSCDLIPSHIPVHKQGTTPAHHRLAMTKLLAKCDTRLSVNEIEIQRDAPSYSANTLQCLSEQHPEQSLCFIMGLDAFLGLPSWFSPERIMQHCHLIVMMREHPNTPNQLHQHLHQSLQSKDKSKLAVQTLPLLNDALKQLLPEYVWKLDNHAQKAQNARINGILRASKHGEVVFVLNDEINISSTELRHAIADGNDVGQWLSEDIANYILTHRLYHE